MSFQAGVEGFDEGRRERNANGISKSSKQHHAPGLVAGEREGFERRLDLFFRCASMPQSVQKIGNPMSQREWFTFNAAGFPVPAGEEDGIGPKASFMSRPRHFCRLSSAVLAPSTASLACGVAHPASLASFDSSREKLTAVMFFASCACGVVHPARLASAGSAPPAWFGPPLLPSVALGVFQPTNATVLRLLSVLPAGLYSSVPGEPAIGVGHPANAATRGN